MIQVCVGFVDAGRLGAGSRHSFSDPIEPWRNAMMHFQLGFQSFLQVEVLGALTDGVPVHQLW
jgi:hypothetical protein